MAKAAVMAAEISGADIIDINMGCPTPKIVSNGDGSALMRNPELAARIISAVVDASPVPVTIKIRKGWDKGSVNCVEFARWLVMVLIQSASTLYPYSTISGRADWDAIQMLSAQSLYL